MRKIYFWLIIIILVLILLAVGGYFGVKYYLSHNFSEEYFLVHPTIAKVFGLSSDKILYMNKEYGFEIIFPTPWKGFILQKNTWKGWLVDKQSINPDYTGAQLLFKNPRTTSEQKWQDIPVMVFTPDVWQMVLEEKLSVSAAPIGPAKIGENSKYIFATPPRWYGFTDEKGWQEAVDVVKTFKVF